MSELGAGETARSIHRIEGTLDKLDGKLDDLDDKVSGWREDVLALKHATEQNTKDIARIEALRSADAAKAETRKWAVYLAVLAATLAFLSQLFFASRGLG